MAKITIDVSAKFVAFRVMGNASFNELVVAIEEHYPSIIHPNIIWDFTEGALPQGNCQPIPKNSCHCERFIFPR